MVFQLLKERNHINDGQQIPLIIDYTTHTDKFLILSVAIPFAGRAIPVYCSMRVYPKKAGKINQVKMERAFLKALNSMLPRKYKYVLVADRGFGNSRFIKDCTDLGFDYLVRIREDWNVGIDGWEVVSSDEFERYGSR